MTTPQVDVTIFKSWAETAINAQKQDIDRLSGSVDRIERDMQILRNFMEETRTELASNRHLQNNKTEEGLANVHGELDTLRQQVNAEPRPVSRENFELSNRSLDIIAQDVQLVSRKVDEVDELKREL
jgi:peptidoglycan hydrolase CwlO-like protein